MARMKYVDRFRPIRCSHYTSRGINLGLSLERIGYVSSVNRRLACDICGETVRGGRGRPPRKEKAAFLGSNLRWACLICGMIYCGIEEEFYPGGHIRRHAKFYNHPLSIRLDMPTEILCYLCYVLEIVRAELEREKKRIEEKRKKQQVITYSASQSKAGRRVKGLPNLGNTCFFNSILQNLFVMDRLRQHLLALDRPRELFTAELKALFVNTHDESIDVIHPNRLLGFLRCRGRNFEARTEHDSHELLIYLLDVLQLEGKVGVNEIFGGQLSSILQCARCGYTSTTYEQFLDLSLQVPSRACSTGKAGVMAPKDKADPDDSDNAPRVAFLKSGKRRASFKERARAKARKKDPNEFISTSDLKVSIGQERITPLATSNIDPGFVTCRRDAFNGFESDLVTLRRCLELFTETEDLSEGRCEFCSDHFQSKSGDMKASDTPMTDQKKIVGTDEQDQVAVSASTEDHTEIEPLCNDEVPDLQKDREKGSGLPSHISAEKDVGHHGQLTKRFLIRRGPPILTIHLKRFKQVGHGSFFKIEGRSIFEETLDLTPYMDCSSMGNDEKCMYRLIGVVEHLGRSLYTGHYVAYVRQGDDTWFKASDHVVEEVSLQQVLQRDAYILFFERK